MREPYDSPVVEGVVRWMAPLILIFGFYVIVHGHYSPGGGFQGGVILAACFMAIRLSLGEAYEHHRFSSSLALGLGTAGLLIFALVGLLPLAAGGEFLDYDDIPVPGLSGPAVRYLSILIVEIGIGLAVWGVLVALFDRLMGSQP